MSSRPARKRVLPLPDRVDTQPRAHLARGRGRDCGFDACVSRVRVDHEHRHRFLICWTASKYRCGINPEQAGG